MDANRHDPNPRPTHPDGPELDLYTIPRHSSWFRWDDIHETEKAALRDFFDGSSITRTPKIYKEYRDFIINKYREDPSRTLTFTDIRKSLIGDVTLLHKVFNFLNKWGLINFGATSTTSTTPDEGIGNVRVEEGAPNGVRVVATPISLKPISVPQVAKVVNESDGAQTLPPLASYSDAFGSVLEKQRKKFSCGVCGESCDSKRYEYTKGSYVMCAKCFQSGKFGEGKSKDDFEVKDSAEGSGNEGMWSEEETLLLLESVMRHGSDWDLVAQHVRTKSKLECIAKLIELPLGDFILNSTNGHGNVSGTNGNLGNSIQVPSSTLKPQEAAQSEDHECANASEQNGDDAEEGPPLKRKCIASLSDAGSSLMKQIALISTMVDSDITAAAAEAAVAALCDETSFPREIFDDGDDVLVNGLQSPTHPNRSHEKEDSDVKEKPTQSETEETMQNDIPLTLRLRAAIATALGAAAARAKLLADQEDREIEHLVSIIIEAQLKKLQCKIKHFDELEVIMEKEHAELEELKEHLIEERIDTLQKAIDAGVSKWKDRDPIRLQAGGVC